MDQSRIAESLSEVKIKISESKKKRTKDISDVCVVLVSKTKPKSDIIEAYNLGGRHFGENYANELIEKANDPEILEFCPEIKWHFIGHLQSNKINKLISIPNLHMIQTIDSSKLCDALEKAWEKGENSKPLRIMVQVNTSNESSKSGISIEEACDLVKHIQEKCPHLIIDGLMTIGSPNHNIELGPNPEFLSLITCRDNICQKLGIQNLELSMGMSDDYTHAIEVGSTCIRIGSCVFGTRMSKSSV